MSESMFYYRPSSTKGVQNRILRGFDITKFITRFWYHVLTCSNLALIFESMPQTFLSCKCLPNCLFPQPSFWLWLSYLYTYYSRHPLSRTSKGAAKRFEIVNVRDSKKSKKKKRKKTVFYILENTLTWHVIL